MIAPHPPSIVVAVVDDDPPIRRALARLLRAAGFEAALFESAEAYMSAPPIPAPLCVIVDVQLPGISGLELQERLRDSGNARPVIMTTGFCFGVIRDRARRNGCVEFFCKPVEGRALLSTIASLASDSRHTKMS